MRRAPKGGKGNPYQLSVQLVRPVHPLDPLQPRADHEAGAAGRKREFLSVGSSGWIRTNDLVVNSHPLYR